MPRRLNAAVVTTSLRIEGGLIPAEELNRLISLGQPAQTQQSEADYGVPRGLKLRDEIARYYTIAKGLWTDSQRRLALADRPAHRLVAEAWVLPLMRQVLGFQDLQTVAEAQRGGAAHQRHLDFPIGYVAAAGSVPVVIAAPAESLDAPVDRCADVDPETGRGRRRSPFVLAQEALNASEGALWAIVTNGSRLRILRDNPSLTRPAYVEIDLEAIFVEDRYADFTAFWLLAHASRFSAVGACAGGVAPVDPADCPWERWRHAGEAVGVTARTHLRLQVAEALRTLGTGFVSHPGNDALRAALQTAAPGEDARRQFFDELLTLVYRLIFLATVEDRTDSATGRPLVFGPEAGELERGRYLKGYSMTMLRERSLSRRALDRHSDLWQALRITFQGLSAGQPALGLPALGGLFDPEACPLLEGAALDNRHLLSAVYQLGFFRQPTGVVRVNYRDMGAEELGSVYESLLELVPSFQALGTPHAARLRFVGDDDEGSSRGNARRLTGSYYTPDSLVKELIRSALEPVLKETLARGAQEPEAALLGLTVCDPACGSGHFLLAAARRIADELTTVRCLRTGMSPTPTDYRHALRDVVSHCIYGVDKNPMAVQLAKTALWLEAYSPDRPLSFIDHHLRVGDALLGVLDPAVLQDGIPDEAYAALSGDDKEVAKDLKKQNKADLKSWRQIAGGDLLTRAGQAAQALGVEELTDDTPEGLARKRAAWFEAEADAQRSAFARLADLYVAAFLAPKTPEWQGSVPMSGTLWQVMSSEPVQPRVEDAARQLCRQQSVFHWWLAFPQVAARGGFDVMLGNPPWERIKLQEEEFFATRSPLVALARNKAERAQRIAWLSEGVLLHQVDPDLARIEGVVPPNRAEMALFHAFIAARRGAEAASLFAHYSRRFALTGVGDVNTYALFAESFLQAMSAKGRAGFIVPTGIATDDSTKAYFGHVAGGGLLASLYDFENREGIFPEIDSRIKFSLLTLGRAEQAEFVCFATQTEQLQDPRRRFRLRPDEFGLINPNTRTCPIFRSERDAELTKKIYRAAPVLIREAVLDGDGEVVQPEVNPWGISFQRMLDMSNDSHLFTSEPDSLESQRLPLYEAKMIHQFDHRWATYVGKAGGTAGEVGTADVTDAQKADPAFSVQPRYWVDEREVLARIARVPSRVSKAWLAVQSSVDASSNDLNLALAQWVAGELFAGMRPSLTSHLELSAVETSQLVEEVLRGLRLRFPTLSAALLNSGLTTRKAMAEFPKWAEQNKDARLSERELEALGRALAEGRGAALIELLDEWMDGRSPRWLMGWRDICRSTDERTVIASVVGRVGVGHKMPLLHFGDTVSLGEIAGLLGNLSSLTLDFVARQKVGGTSLTYHYLKQLSVLAPDHYTPADLAFIVPRVLELTYTAHDLRAWGEDLSAYDPRPAGERGRPFPWDPSRRACLRAELDAYYARLYGLTRDDLRYILDPADVMGVDYPSETFRVLMEGEMRALGEYRTRRLVLEAWDRQCKH